MNSTFLYSTYTWVTVSGTEEEVINNNKKIFNYVHLEFNVVDNP